MKLKEDQSRIKELLKDTITLLCKNGLQYKAGFSVEALIGITLDEEDVFLVNIKESVRTEEAKDTRAEVEVTVQKRRHTADGSESEHEGFNSPYKKEGSQTPRHSRKRPPDSSPPSFDQSSPAKQTRMHTEYDDASNASSTHYQSEQSKDSMFNIKAEPEDDDELVFVKQEGGNELSSCSQGNPFPLGQFQTGHHGQMNPGVLNPNFPFDSNLPQTGATSNDSLPGMSTWTSSQPGQQMPAIAGSQGAQPGHVCRYCMKVYTRKWSLTTHIQREHEFENNPLILHCTCGMSFRWSSTLCRHRKKCGLHQKVAEQNFQDSLQKLDQSEMTNNENMSSSETNDS